MKRNPDADWKPECSHCGDTMQVKCSTCHGAGCIDCNYEGKRWCPYCTGKHKPKAKRRIDIRR